MMITLKSFIIGWGENDDLRKLFDMAFDFSNKKRKNHCMAMNIGEYMLCGKPCEDVFCHKHMLQIQSFKNDSQALQGLWNRCNKQILQPLYT